MKKNIALAIMSVLAFIIGIIWVSVAKPLAIIIMTVATVVFIVAIGKLINLALANRDRITIRTRVSMKDIIMTAMAVIIVIFLIILLCRGCSPVDTAEDNLPSVSAEDETDDTNAEHIGTLYVDNLIVNNEKVEKQEVVNSTVEKQEVETQEVVEQTVEENYTNKQTVVEQKVVTSKVEKQEVIEQKVETQEVESQKVETSTVEKQEVAEQHVEVQKVEKQENVTSQPEPQVVPQPEVESTPVEVHTHSYTTKREEPTCEKNGKIVETCSCGDTKTTVLPALGHSIADAIEVDATCTENGKVDYVCTCGKIMKTQTIKAKGHVWNDGKVTVEPTEKKTGKSLYTCETCGETKTETLDKLAHTHNYSWEESEEATCEEDGLEEYICECGEVLRTRDIDAFGHDWDDGEVTVEPTEKKIGKCVYTCETCGETKTETLDKLEHTHDYSWEVAEEPTCEEEGLEENVCECGEVLRTRDIDALGHDYEVVAEKEPTATQDGYTKYSCNNCGDTYNDTIPATGEEEPEPEPEKPAEVKLAASSFVIHEGETVKVTTTGDSSNLELIQSMDQLKMEVINDSTVELSVKTPGVGGTVSVKDITTGASVKITIEFIYD